MLTWLQREGQSNRVGRVTVLLKIRAASVFSSTGGLQRSCDRYA